jgi:hypothetical protein
MTKRKTKTNKTINEAYFDWLFDQIEERQYSGLKDFVYALYLYPFVCRIANDDNRVEDGLTLRNTFYDEQDIDPSQEDDLSRPCTILEMLIALAGRMNFVLFDPHKGDQVSLWFWLFVDNLNLQKYDHDDEDALRKKKFNRIVLRKFVNREYQSNGKGGLFPLNNPNSDQREVELWYQMMAYINENYDI